MRQFRRSRTFAFAVGFVIAAGGGALAAWVIFSGASGTGGAKIGTSTTQTAITLVAHTPTTEVVPGSPGPVLADVTNNNSVPVTITSLTASSITATPTCDTSALSFSTTGGQLGNIAPGLNIGLQVGTLTAAPDLDPTCAGATITLQLTGTTNP